MSETLAAAAANVRTLLNEDDPADYAVDTVTLYYLFVAKARDLGLPWNLGLTTAASSFSLTAGSTADYSLPTGLNAAVEILWVPSLGRELIRKSLGEITQMRYGITDTATGTSDPQFYALFEDSTARAKVRVNCIPTTTRPVDVTYSASIASTYTDATVVPMDEQMLAVIEKATALECLARMLPKQREEREIAPETLRLWAAEIPEMRRRAMERAHRLKANPVYLEDRI